MRREAVHSGVRVFVDERSPVVAAELLRALLAWREGLASRAGALSRSRPLDGVLLTRVLLAESKTEAARTRRRAYVDCKTKTQCHRPSLNRTVARTTLEPTLAAGTHWALYRRHSQMSGQPSTGADGTGSSRHDPYSCRAPKLNTERRYKVPAFSSKCVRTCVLSHGRASRDRH